MKGRTGIDMACLRGMTVAGDLSGEKPVGGSGHVLRVPLFFWMVLVCALEEKHFQFLILLRTK